MPELELNGMFWIHKVALCVCMCVCVLNTMNIFDLKLACVAGYLQPKRAELQTLL